MRIAGACYFVLATEGIRIKLFWEKTRGEGVLVTVDTDNDDGSRQIWHMTGWVLI